MKKIKVQIEVPTDWYAEGQLESLGFFTRSVKGVIEDEVKEAVKEKLISKMKLPKVKITKAEIKQAVLEEIANRKIDDSDSREL